MTAMTSVTLRPMTEPEYADYRARAVPTYAANLARARGMDPDAALSHAEDSLATTLPQAIAPDRTWLMRVLTADGDAIGWLRLGPHTFRDDGVYVNHILIDDAHQGRGLGRATMLAAEELARKAGLRHIALNVFGWNDRAEALYRSLGYVTQCQEMDKPLVDPT
jgi:GNAT superfamily N-acetyltransferase